MALVVDASVAIKWFVREAQTEQARRLIAIPDPLIAPDWIMIEAASTFSRKVRESKLLLIHAERHLQDLPRFFERLHPSVELVQSALMLSYRLRHPVYDCLYLVLAEREDTRLITADQVFAAAADDAGFGKRVALLP